MNAANNIFNETLPDNRNFTKLKSLGLQYVQEMSGNSWSDLNESDPGVTILEQLCYALTELGYCNNFPLEDILTEISGQIDYHGQFYFPNEIFTCSPVTLSDYRKLLLDRIQELRNVYVAVNVGAIGAYQFYLYADPTLDGDKVSAVQSKAFELLNECRNFGEIFLPPVVLSPLKFTLKGQLQIDSSVTPEMMLSRIKQSLESYVSPEYQQFGYQALRDKGLQSDEIFNGPILQKGWMEEVELSSKKLEQVIADDVIDRVAVLPGVIENINLKLSEEEYDSLNPDEPGTVPPEYVAAFVVDSSNISFSQNDNVSTSPDSLNCGIDLAKLQSKHQNTPIGATVDLTPSYPKGKYRNIGEYYSVQNTFPVQYAIGYDSAQSESSKLHTAQTRQLKGYLMAYDQLLANQFSQLANVSKLFSFRTGQKFYDSGEKWYSGIPYQYYIQTYFYQPLYGIPNVEPLLLGADAFKFSLDENVNSPEWKLGWKNFTEDPFNRYISGLRDSMEDAAVSDDRQNRMVDHLLARHGEIGSLYDEMIGRVRWLGSLEKTKIIVKRILLQNYQAISYHRGKAYNYQAAEKLSLPGRYCLSRQEYQRLQTLEISSEILRELEQFVDQFHTVKAVLLLDIFKWLGEYFELEEIAILYRHLNLTDTHLANSDSIDINGWLDIGKLELQKKLLPSDFSNYSTFELVSDLILGLTDYYQSMASILVQLTANENFKNWLKTAELGETFALPHSDITVERQVVSFKQSEGFLFRDQICDDGQAIIDIDSYLESPTRSIYYAHIDQLLWLAQQRKGFIALDSTLLNMAKDGQGGDQDTSLTLGDQPDEAVIVSVDSFFACQILPGYVRLFSNAKVIESITLLSQQYLQVQISRKTVPASFYDLYGVIVNYVGFSNAMRYFDSADKEKKKISRQTAREAAIQLLKQFSSSESGGAYETS